MPDHALQFESTLRESLAALGVGLTAPQIAVLRSHYEAVVATNRDLNLTRITDPAEAAVKHYVDSLALLAWMTERSRSRGTILDIGTGAGFPAVPLAVALPEWGVTALEARHKKALFVQRTAHTLGLKNLTAIHAHGRHWSAAESFDLVLFRALGGFAEGLEQACRFVKPHGHVVVWRTAAQWESESESISAAVSGSRLTLQRPFRYTLRLGDEEMHRVLAVLRRRRSA